MTFTPTIRGWVTLAVCVAATVAGVWTRYPSLIGFGVALVAVAIACFIPFRFGAKGAAKRA